MRPVRSSRSRGVAAALATACLLLTSCGGSDGDLRVGGASEADRPDDEPTEAETAEAPESTEEPEPTQEPTEPAPIDEPLTAPGTTLALLDSASVPVETDTGAQGVVSLAVADVVVASAAELGTPEPGPDEDPPVFVTYQVIGLSGAAELAGWNPDSALSAVTSDGRFLGAVAVVGGSDACPRLEIPPGWTEGEPLLGCYLAQSPPDNPLAGIAYYGGTEDYAQQPVVWQAAARP